MMQLLGFLLSTYVGAACPDLSQTIQQKVQANTFKLVPRNFYASSMPVERARELFQSQCLTQNLTISDQMNCHVLSSCTGDDCKIEFMPFGTAFYLQQKKALLTAWHVVFSTHATPLYFMQNSLAPMSRDELNSHLSVLQPDFLLLNSKDEVIYDTKKQSTHYRFWGDPLSTIYQELGLRNKSPYGYFENAPDDFVAISVSGLTTVEPLTLSSSKDKSTEAAQCLYAAGYQYHDGHFRFSSGVKKSVKEMQSQLSFVTPFQLNTLPMDKEKLLQLPVSEVLAKMGYDSENIQNTLKKYDESVIWNSIQIVLASQARHLRDQSLEDHPSLLFYDASVLPGQSGGPILTQEGDVIGLTTNSFFDKHVVVNGHFASYGAVGLRLTAFDSYWSL